MQSKICKLFIPRCPSFYYTLIPDLKWVYFDYRPSYKINNTHWKNQGQNQGQLPDLLGNIRPKNGTLSTSISKLPTPESLFDLSIEPLSFFFRDIFCHRQISIGALQEKSCWTRQTRYFSGIYDIPIFKYKQTHPLNEMLLLLQSNSNHLGCTKNQ